MDSHIIAQLIGFLGYIFYISAPHFKTQKQIVQIDVLASVIICSQWFMLGQPTLLALNLLVIVTSVITLRAQTDVNVRKFLYLLYPVGCIILATISQGSIIGMLAIIAFCCGVASKSSQNIMVFRTYAAITAMILVLSGIIALSLPAIIFNILFAFGHVQKLWQNTLRAQPQPNT